MKQAYVVAGPESSGNRLLAALLVRAGCIGSGSMAQPFELPTYESPSVIVRSFPHGNDWPDLRDVYHALRDRGYMVRVLIPVRDPWCVVQSQHSRQHHPPELALANVRRTYADIFAQLGQLNVWWLLVPYEAMVLHPVQAVRRLLELLGLPTDNLGSPIIVEGVEYETVNDANAVHHGATNE